MPSIESLKQRSVELLSEVKSKTDMVEKGEITPAEFNTYMDNAGTENTEITTAIKNFALAKSFEVEGDGAPPAPEKPSDRVLRGRKNMAAYKAASEAAAHGQRGSFSFDIDVKTQGIANLMGEQTSGTSAPATGSLAQGVYFQAGTAGAAVEPEFIPGIVEMRFYPNVIAELFPSFPVSSPLVSYVKETSWTNSSAAVPEGATKPTSVDALTRYAEQVGKIANLSRVTDELVQDAPYFWSLIQRRGVMGVTRSEEVGLLAGVGMPGINGLLNRTAGSSKNYPVGFTSANGGSPASTGNSIQIPGAAVPGAGALPLTVTGVSVGRASVAITGVGIAEDILAAITDIRVNTFFEPDAILVNPVDWTTIRLAKDSQGQYLGGSFFGASYGQSANAGPTGIEPNLTLWGLRLVSTPAIPPGYVIVGDFSDAGQVLRLGGLRVDLTNTNGTDFEQNLWTIRIEERVGLMVDRPELFQLIALAGGS